MGPRSGFVLALGGMLSVQIGAALTVDLLDDIGPSGAAWLRVGWAALFLAVAVRPRWTAMDPAHRNAALSLGAATAVMLIAYLGSIARLPLGTASALQFLGPLGVAIATRASGAAGLVLPAVAALGVLGLTEPWTGEADGLGVVLALVAGAGWAAYIVLTRRVGGLLPGFSGLALSLTVAAVLCAPFGIPDVADHVPARAIVALAGIALLMPVLAFSLELVALRRTPTATFGIYMCLEPALGMLVGLIFLGQDPRVLGVLGMLLVVAAGVAAQTVTKSHSEDAGTRTVRA